MKIVLTSPTYPPFNSGLGNAVARQADQLVRRGVEVIVATGGGDRNTRQARGVRIEEFAVNGAECLHRPIRGDAKGYTSFLRREPFDAIVMHGWQIWSTDLALQQASDIGGRKIVYSHGVSVNSYLRYRPVRSAILYALWRPYWWSLADKMRKLDAIVFLAEAGDDDRFDDVAVARRVGLPIHVIPNSLPYGVRGGDPARARTQIAAVGAYTPAKGFDFVLRAYAASNARNRMPLAFFGQESTAYLETLRRLSNALGIDPSMVSFNLGVADEPLRAEYVRSKLVVSGSHTECQPLVLLDAMATGTPFVARATGCISSMPGGVAIRSEAEAAAEIDRLLSDADAWEALSRDGVEAAAGRFDADRNADLFMDVVRGLS